MGVKPTYVFEKVQTAPFSKGSFRVVTRRSLSDDVDLKFAIINDHGDVVAKDIENRGDARLFAYSKDMYRMLQRFAYVDSTAAELIANISTEVVAVRNEGEWNNGKEEAQERKNGRNRKYEPFD